jgi:hypothetical protein
MTKLDLNVSWDHYYSLLTSRRRYHPRDQVELHIFDHPDYSYLGEIDKCRELFQLYSSFATVPCEKRKVIAGWGGGVRHPLGNMKGAGHFKHIVLDSPASIAVNLDRIPLDVDVSVDQLQAYLEAMLQISGVGIAASTRLLAVKRPDRFVPMTGQNKQAIRRRLNTPITWKGYVDLHTRIWSLPWFNAREPQDKKERRIWCARVALLDFLLYGVTSGGLGKDY